MKKEDEIITQNAKSANFNSFSLILIFYIKKKNLIRPSTPPPPPPQQKYLTINFWCKYVISLMSDVCIFFLFFHEKKRISKLRLNLKMYKQGKCAKPNKTKFTTISSNYLLLLHNTRGQKIILSVCRGSLTCTCI